MVELPSRPLAEIDPEFERMALETGELTYGLRGTAVREKLLQNLANDICRQHLGLACRLHVQAAHMYGVPYPDLLALVRFVAPFAGYPAAADALARLGELAVEFGMDTRPSDSDRSDQATIPGFDTGDPWMARFLANRNARAWSESRLSPRERAIVALTVDVSQQTLDDSFRLHLRWALDSGVSPSDIRDAVRFCAEMGVAKAVVALDALDALLSELRN